MYALVKKSTTQPCPILPHGVSDLVEMENNNLPNDQKITLVTDSQYISPLNFAIIYAAPSEDEAEFTGISSIEYILLCTYLCKISKYLLLSANNLGIT